MILRDPNTLISLLEFLGFITVVCVVGYIVIDRDIRQRHEVQLTGEESKTLADYADAEADLWRGQGNEAQARRWDEISAELDRKERITSCAGS